MAVLTDFKQRARRLKEETFALYLVARHPGTPWYAKLFVAGIVAYAFSPIDLIPDFVPVLGYLDDLILIPWVLLWLSGWYRRQFWPNVEHEHRKSCHRKNR